MTHSFNNSLWDEKSRHSILYSCITLTKHRSTGKNRGSLRMVVKREYLFDQIFLQHLRIVTAFFVFVFVKEKVTEVEDFKKLFAGRRQDTNSVRPPPEPPEPPLLISVLFKCHTASFIATECRHRS